MIQTLGLWRAYGQEVAVHPLTLDVRPGEILGFLGPNGAGKSTTVKMLTGLIRPSGGRARVAGYDVLDEPLEVKRRIGYVPESAVLYESLTGREFLEVIAALHHQPRARALPRIDGLLERFGLTGARDQRLSEYSKGMKQKVLIASALMHNPDVLFLDEPLTGLDVGAALLVKEVIRTLAAEGRTVFFCSHVLEVVERVCTRVVIINAGKTVAEGTPAEIVSRAGRTSFEEAFAALTGAGSAVQVTRDLLDALRR